MKKTTLQEWISTNGLRSCEDSSGKQAYRRVPFGPARSPDEIDAMVRLKLREAREASGLTIKDVGAMLGITHQVVRRSEKQATRLPMARFMHFCEVLGVNPASILFSVAPHVWGSTVEAATLRHEIMNALLTMDEQSLKVVKDLMSSAQRLVEHHSEPKEGVSQ